jgi:2-dehydro-3-deoxygalactonokinase
MRGEETQLLGALGADATDEAVVCLPGTHSKWVRVNGGTVERFATFMTGELSMSSRAKRSCPTR